MTLPPCCSSFRKERPRLFARAGWQKKNFSIFHAESMSSVSNQANVRQSGDVVRDGIEGIIVPSGDVAAIAGAIEHLYQNPKIVSEMSTAARERAVENFTWDHFRERLLRAYEMAMQML